MTEVRHYIQWNGQLTEATAQRRDYIYDTYTGSQNAWGRLAAVQFGSEVPGTTGPLTYAYSYNVGGRVTSETFSATMAPACSPNCNPTPLSMTAQYGWDNEGKMTALTYPDGAQASFGYNDMGQVASMSFGTAPYRSATYGPDGAMATISSYYQDAWGNYWPSTYEQRTYNSMGQLTQTTGAINMQYTYSATQNNGRIVQSVDGRTGETVSYQYDALNRLIHAETADTTWGESYQYDQYGNLLLKTPTKGTAPAWAASYDPATGNTE